MLKILFLIGPETPMDLLLLSLYLNHLGELPPGLMIGVQRDRSFKLKQTSKKIWNVLKCSGLSFVVFNILMNMDLGRRLGFDDKTLVQDLESLKKHYNFPLFHFDRVNSERTLSIINDFSPDIIINHMAQMIKHPLIDIPPRGIVNVHPGIVPEYQGMGSCLWPLIDKYPFHGPSLHYIKSEEFDVGPIIAVGRFNINPIESVLSLHIKSRIIAALLTDNLTSRLLENEEIKSRPQVNGKYHKLPTKIELQKIRSNGHKYISWSDRKILSESVFSKFEYYDQNTNWEWSQWVMNS
ncbi:MAG: hypothetical protein GY928_02940 [Colwellia sp.]|nr:hypothetical protein [Colwellia sp.]